MKSVLSRSICILLVAIFAFSILSGSSVVTEAQPQITEEDQHIDRSINGNQDQNGIDALTQTQKNSISMVYRRFKRQLE